MKKFRIYKLHFTAPLHLGDERADYDKSLSVYHSDSMYAAIISVLAKVGYAIPEKGDLGFSISSLFPFYQKEEKGDPVFFLPKIKKQDDFDSDIRKKVKRIEWLDVSSFNDYINGKSLFNNSNTGQMKGVYYTNQDIGTGFISTEVNPRVTVSRSGQEDARPFYMERLYFKDYSGLYFIFSGENSSVLEKTLNVLKNEGIGTDRTVGNGLFEWEFGEIQLKLPESEYASNLSLFIPEDKEQTKQMLEGNIVAYNIQKRGGWITDSGLNSFRKNNIYAFTEGSVFKIPTINQTQFFGKTVDLKPKLNYEHIGVEEHPIWRNGKAIFIPVKM